MSSGKIYTYLTGRLAWSRGRTEGRVCPLTSCKWIHPRAILQLEGKAGQLAPIPSDSGASRPRQQRLHCTLGAAPPHWGPARQPHCAPRTLTRARKGNQVLEQMAGPSDGVRRQGYLASPDRWLGWRPPGPMPQLENGVRHGLEVSRSPDFLPHWGGNGIPPRVPGMCRGNPWAWSLAF